MKKIPIILALVAVALVAYSMSNWGGKESVVASKNITIETRDVSDFSKIDVSGAFKVDITYGSEEKVEVEVPDNLQKYVKVKARAGKLYIEGDSKTSIKSSCDLLIHIKTARLNDFELSGASSIQLNNTLKDDSFSLESSGATNFKGTLDVNEVEMDLSGASSARLEGRATKALVDLSGASNLTDYEFEIEDAFIDLSGASTAKITSLKSIKADVSGASSLHYKGNPAKNDVIKSGASSVKKH